MKAPIEWASWIFAGAFVSLEFLIFTHLSVSLLYLYPEVQSSGFNPKLVVNSFILSLSTCWNALSAGILRDVDNALLKVIVPKYPLSQFFIERPLEYVYFESSNNWYVDQLLYSIPGP